MPDHGTQLGVDLNELYRMAHFLTEVHADFFQAASDLTAAYPPADSGPWQTTVGAWDGLRSAINDLLTDNAEALSQTSDALTNIAQQYAAADQAAAASFTALQQSDASEQGWSSWPSPTT